MNIYVLNSRKYFDPSAFISNLSDLIVQNKPFDVSYPISDKNLQHRLSELFQRHNVKAYLEQKSDEEVDGMKKLGAQYGYLTGLISGYFITSSDTFKNFIIEAGEAITDGIVSTAGELVSETASEAIGESINQFSPLIGAAVKIAFSFGIAKTGKKLGESITHKYFIRSNLSTNKPAPEVIEQGHVKV